MWRVRFVAVLSCLLCLNTFAQSSEDMENILKLAGYDSPEDMDEYEVERLCSYLERPVRINTSSASLLRSCGLFGAYQTAALLDYRTRHGDILSYSELSSVDGFNEESVRLLSPFISLEGGDIHANGSGTMRPTSDIAARTSMSIAEEALAGSYAVKCRSTFGNNLSLSLSASGKYEGSPVPAGNISWEPARIPVRIMAGDFNARFGQGLALWNGMSMTGLSKVSSFLRSSSGLSSSWSFTGSAAHTGIAGEYSFSRMRLSAFVAFPGIKTVGIKGAGVLPALNIGWYGRNMCVSLTHYLETAYSDAGKAMCIPDMKTSTDIALCIKGVDVFSEIAFDWVSMTPAVLAGIRYPDGEDVRMAAHLRYYPDSFNPVRSAAVRSVSKCSNEYGISLCCDYDPDSGRFAGSLSVDSAYLPVSKADAAESIHVKVIADSEITLSESLTLKLKLSERFRTWGRLFRTDVRADLEWSLSRFSMTGRLNVLNCAETGFLSYLEGGYRTDRLSVYIRQLFFLIDNWDDRIYAYERDAPGSFSVPAYYGRGMSTALTASWKFSRWGRVYVKGTMTSYPFMKKKKPGKAGLKLQFVFSF